MVSQTRINAALHKIADLFSDFEADWKRVGRMAVSGPTFEFLASQKEFTDGASLELRPDWDESGLRGTFWNAQIYVNDHVPDDHVILFPDGDKTSLTRTVAILGHTVSPF